MNWFSLIFYLLMLQLPEYLNTSPANQNNNRGIFRRALVTLRPKRTEITKEGFSRRLINKKKAKKLSNTDMVALIGRNCMCVPTRCVCDNFENDITKTLP